MSQALSGDKLLDTLLFDTNIVGIFVWDFDGRILHANDAFLSILGYEREDLVAGRMRWSDLTPPDLLDRQAERLRVHQRTGRLQPFEKEYLRKDGSRVPVLVGVSRFEEPADQGVGFVLDLTERKRAEQEHGAHVWFLESMDRINRAMQGTNDVETMMGDVLAAVLEVFESDRAWLLYSRDADATTWRAVMERTRPEFASAAAKDHDLVMSGDAAQVVRDALASPGSLPAGPGHERQVKRDTAEHAQVQSEILMALRPKGGRAYLFGLHQCSRPRTWTKDEQRLFEEIGHRLSDALANLIVMRGLRESEERFRALVQFSFDVYWETDAQHRFIRQDISERAPEGPLPGSEIGKTRWELPYLEIDEEAWRKHREMLDAHLPFRDFEYARPTPGGGKRYAAVSGLPMFDETGRFVGYRGVARHITERKLVEAERRAHLWFLESMDRIHRAMQGTNDVERMMSDVLNAVLEIFSCDRAWLLYPCDPDAPSWRAVMEHTRPEFPGAAALGRDLPMSADAAEVARAARDSLSALLAGHGHGRDVKREIAERFGVRSEMLMALHPKGDRPYLFSLHQCSRPRTWTNEEQRLFEETGHRLSDALSTLIAFRSLRESETRLDAAQRIARVGWWERDYATGHVSLSDEACRIFGVQPLDLPQWHGRWVSLIHPEDRERTAAASEIALAGGARYDVEYRVVRPDGKVHVVHSQGDVTRDESGRPVRQFGVMQDITELRRVEDDLRASEARFRTFVDRATDAFYLMDEQLRVVDVNRHACESLGWSREELIGMHPREFDVGLDEPSIARLAQRAGAGEAITFETRHRRKDGTAFPVEIRTGTFKQGGKLFYLALARDISERKRVDAELRARQEMLDLAQTAARAVAFDWCIGARESANRWSPELEAMYGLEPGTFDGTYEGWKKLVHPDDWPAVKLAIKRAQESGDVAAEYRVIHGDGTVHCLRARGRMFFDPEGRPERMVGFMIDVTDRWQAEEELRASEARFRTLVEFAADGFMLHAGDATVIDANRQACENLGYSREELIGMKPTDFDADLDPGALQRVSERIGAGDIVTIETHHRRKDGTVFPVELRLRQILQGGRRFTISLARDITERKRVEEERERLRRLEAELAHVSRLTALGELTTSIVHEVSQPLGGMVASAGACARWLAADPPAMEEARAALDHIVADGKRAREVIARIRALTKRQEPRKDRLEINLKIAEVLALTEHELRSHDIVVRTDLASTLPRLAGDRVQLQQVLLNLILNAIEAMRAVHDRPRELTIVSRQDGPDAVLVEVRDSGTGLDPERAERVFEAFYTTKPEGIGIGLSISRSIIEAHGGRLWAGPNAPYGAVFRFSLPVAEEAAQ